MIAFASPALLLLMTFGRTSGEPATEVPTYTIKGPTVIAFFRPVTDAELEKESDKNEVLSDFQLYASQAAPRLKRAGIDFEVASAVKFRLKYGGSVRTFTAGKIGVGYYFVAPGKKPRVEYGVHDDLDIMEIARKYFRLSIDTK
jgi:hypothetical protein